MMFSKWKYFIISTFFLLTIICCILIPKTNINYNSLLYLPDDSKTKIAYEVMEKEFGDNGSLYVFIDQVDSDVIISIKNQLLIDGVKSVEYTTNQDKVLYNLVLNNGDYSQEASQVIEKIILILDEGQYHYYLNGQSYLTYYFNQNLNNQIIKIVLLLSPLLILIIILTTKSYLEPVLFIIVIGISVLLNMGTNALLDSVSYMTHSIAAVIQIAVCMDYSIMLLHSYQSVKQTEPDAKKAITIAWKSTFVPIVSSALTTIAGFIAIMIMRYRIGFDIGLVLAKGVLSSLITILLLLPCLILVSDKLIIKTTHKSFLIKDSKVKNVSLQYRFIILMLTIILICAGFFIQTKNKFLYSDNTTTQNMKEIDQSSKTIEKYFGYQSPAILLIDANVDACSLIEKLENVQIDNVSYLSSVYALDKKMTNATLYELVKDYGITLEETTFIMQIFNKEMLSLRELMQLLPQLNQTFDQSQMLNFINKFINLSNEDLKFIYNLSGKDKLTPFELISLIYQEYDQDTLKTVLTEEELTKIFLTIGKEKVTLLEIFTFFKQMFTTESDANTINLMLNNSVQIEFINKVLMMKDKEKLSLNTFIATLLSDFSEEEMILILTSFDENFIHNIYQVMKNNNLLSNDKTSIKNFIEFILNNYQSNLSETEISLLNTQLAIMIMLETMNGKINSMLRQFETFNYFYQMNLINLTKFAFIDFNIIKNEFIGSKYQRIILSINLPEESETSFAYFTKLEEEIENSNVGDYYLISRTTSIMDIKETSKNDYLYASILSIVMVFIIILLSFKSFTIPVILIVLIQGAVFINMAIPALLGEEILFMGYIIVSCIQLGATIDYAILTTHRYTNNRKKFSKSESMYKAINESKSSILTSGLIFTLAGLSLAFFSSIPVIRSMGRLIGIGGAISMLMVLFLLPQILFISDKIIIKNNFNH